MQNSCSADDKCDKLYTVRTPGKRLQAHLNRITKSYLFTDTLVYTIAHWSGPPITFSLVKIDKADWSMLERLLLLHV